jgi:hypothetical protein
VLGERFTFHGPESEVRQRQGRVGGRRSATRPREFADNEICVPPQDAARNTAPVKILDTVWNMRHREACDRSQLDSIARPDGFEAEHAVRSAVCQFSCYQI